MNELWGKSLEMEQFWGLVARPEKLKWHGQGSKALCKGPDRTKWVPQNTHGNKITKKEN